MEPRLKEGSLRCSRDMLKSYALMTIVLARAFRLIFPNPDLLKELEKDLTEPTKGTSFVQHLFTAYWQYHQFKQCRQNPEEGNLLQ